jgi:hypothetical protein
VDETEENRISSETKSFERTLAMLWDMFRTGLRSLVSGVSRTPRSSIQLEFYTVDSRLSARSLTALRLNRGNVFLKKIFIFRITFV